MQMSAIVPFKVIFLFLSHLSQSRCYIHLRWSCFLNDGFPKEASGKGRFHESFPRPFNGPPWRTNVLIWRYNKVEEFSKFAISSSKLILMLLVRMHPHQWWCEVVLMRKRMGRRHSPTFVILPALALVTHLLAVVNHSSVVWQCFFLLIKCNAMHNALQCNTLQCNICSWIQSSAP